MEQALKDAIDWLMSPINYTLISIALVAGGLKWRKFFTKNVVIIAFFVLFTVFLGWAWGDANFRKIIAKPDNVPIIILLLTIVYFTWLAMRHAVINDERLKRGEPSLEGELAKQKVFTWPDLVYSEFICLILFTALLVVWSIKIGAPIEEPAATARTPNPSKAPWYFLGLQEMLVYFDPWIAGVLLPSFIVIGLMAIPYLDKNPKGNGYYTFEERPFAISFWMVGFLLFWISLVILGTFLRGPNWSFFGPFEYWDLHKLEPAVNTDLSAMVWVKGLGVPRPDNPWIREAPGLIVLAGYFLVLPLLMAKTVFKKVYVELGAMRYQIFVHMFLWFILLPIKMGLRWTISLKYIVGLPEYFLNV